jgi:hypothetical protein
MISISSSKYVKDMRNKQWGALDENMTKVEQRLGIVVKYFQ